MRIEIARDKKTGFPCLRRQGMPDFAALLPVTKLQAEEWIWREGIADPDGVAGLVRRLEVRRTDEENLLPPAVHSLERLPIGKLAPRTALSILASNLSLWTSREKLPTLRTFPTAASEWGLLLRWLHGRIPQYAEWRRTQDAFAPLRTQDLLQQVLERSYEWPPAVERLLRKVKELVPRDARGLPFMGLGLCELIADTELVQRLVGGLRQEARPQVVGASPAWPSLETVESSGWRPLRSRVFPVVTVRPWFRELDVLAPAAGFDAFELTTQPAEGEPSLVRGRKTTIQRTRLSSYVPQDDKMKNRCPHCHEVLKAEFFKKHATFDCFETLVEIKQQDGSFKSALQRDHGGGENQPKSLVVSTLYLDLARKRPELIHTVALAGYAEAGKSTFLYSLGGLMNYPDGRSVISSAFPREWAFFKQRSTINDFAHARGGGVVDPLPAIEAMWLDGVLPGRNDAEREAARDHLLFRATPSRSAREVLLILDDMAGEIISRPKMATNKYFPHFASVADIIYFVPAENMSYNIMEKFVTDLRQAQSEGVPIKLKKTNLIFVISKTDQLRYGSFAEQELLRRILPKPYKFPRQGDRNELKAYFEDMEEVHHGIMDWLRSHKPDFPTLFDEFGSVRCCGLSAFGFQPTREPRVREEQEYSLAFRPEPVRVVDPIFWLLKENGLIHF